MAFFSFSDNKKKGGERTCGKKILHTVSSLSSSGNKNKKENKIYIKNVLHHSSSYPKEIFYKDIVLDICYINQYKKFTLGPIFSITSDREPNCPQIDNKGLQVICDSFLKHSQSLQSLHKLWFTDQLFDNKSGEILEKVINSDKLNITELSAYNICTNNFNVGFIKNLKLEGNNRLKKLDLAENYSFHDDEEGKYLLDLLKKHNYSVETLCIHDTNIQDKFIEEYIKPILEFNKEFNQLCEKIKKEGSKFKGEPLEAFAKIDKKFSGCNSDEKIKICKEKIVSLKKCFSKDDKTKINNAKPIMAFGKR